MGLIMAVAAVLGAVGMLIHLVAATDLDRLAAGEASPLTDLDLITETITSPIFGFAVAAMAVVGGVTRMLGNLWIAVPGLLGGLADGLAGGTIVFTDALNFLFPFSSGIGVWGVAVGIWMMVRARSTTN